MKYRVTIEAVLAADEEPEDGLILKTECLAEELSTAVACAIKSASPCLLHHIVADMVVNLRDWGEFDPDSRKEPWDGYDKATDFLCLGADAIVERKPVEERTPQ